MRPRFPLVTKITAASFLVALGVLAFVVQAEYKSERAQLEDKFGMTLQHIVQTAALFLDGDAHERVRGPADAAGPDFQRLRAVLDRARRENGLGEDQLYTLRPVVHAGHAGPGGGDGGAGSLEFVIMLQQRTFIGDRYVPPPLTRPLLERVLREGAAGHTPLYRDQNGSYVSGYAPIRRGDGRVVAILEADYPIDRFVAELQRNLRQRLWVVPAALLLALVLSGLVARSITAAVGRLVSGTLAVRRGVYDLPVEVRTRDELRTLAEAFNEMLVGLRERFAMLRFVPRHTRAVIAEALKEHADLSPELVARRRHVTVLFSDIRGFTPLSESLAAERVIGMLGVYLREAARIIERHEGSVDKFIGDAVMALFEGPDRCARAAGAAVAIQQAIAEGNASGAYERPIAVGIGVAEGEVVMGNVGYEDRMEFAVIGRIVNLASRLTSVAGPGQIVVSAEVFDALSPDGPAEAPPIAGIGSVERVDGLQLKGIASGVTCYKLTPRRAPVV